MKKNFQKWFFEWQENVDLLNNYIVKITEERHHLNRKSEIGKIIQSLLKRSLFPFAREFVAFAKFKNASDEKIKSLIKEIDKLLKLCEKGFLPTQSNGYPIARGSLNYYTIFKNQKDFSVQINEITGDKNNIDYKVITSFFKHCFEVYKILNQFINVRNFRMLTEKFNIIKKPEQKVFLQKTNA